jgi:DNA-binding transcriptional MocR family regulator
VVAASLGLTIDPRSPLPVYRQIADGIRQGLGEGRLQPGLRLPATRDLARALQVNRNTVVAAYEALGREGVVASHTGRGTFLVDPKEVPVPEPADPFAHAFARAVEGSKVASLLSVYRTAISGEGISFAGSFPAAELMPVEPFRRAMGAVLRERGAELLSYGATGGYAPLREAVAEGMRRRGSRVDADEILVTNGSQQALELVFRTFVDPGDPVLVEDLTYTGALSVLASLDARVVGVPGDEEGIRLDLLTRALERHRARVLYVQPTFHNPTARVMGEARRRELLALAARHGCIVVEDDWAGDLRFEGVEVPTLHALDGGSRVVYVSTFSKKLLPGLRVGWVAAPAPVLERLVALKQVADCGTSPLLQAALHRFLADGGLDDHLRRVRRTYRERRDAMLAGLARHLAGQAVWTRPEGGLFVWARLLHGLDATALFGEAAARGVLFSRGELFHAEGLARDCLRLTYGGVSPEQIEAGLAILGQLVGARERRPEVAAAEWDAVPIL